MFRNLSKAKRKLAVVLAGAAVTVAGVSLAFAAGDGSEPVNAAGNDNAALFEEYMTEGAQIFAQNCASCHGAEGNEALSTHVEIIADNSRAVSNTSRMLRRIVHGGIYMPAIGAALEDREVAAVATFIRNSWGNEYDMVTEEEVVEIR